MELFAAHGLNLLSDVRPIQLSVVHQLAPGTTAQQRALSLGPGEDVGIVVAHGARLRPLLWPLLFKPIVDPDRQQRRTAEVPAVSHGIHLLQQFRGDRQRDLGLVAALPADRLSVGCAGDKAAFGVLDTRLRARFCNGHTVSFALTCNSSAMENALRSSPAISSHAFGSRGLISTTARPRPVAFANALRRRIRSEE